MSRERIVLLAVAAAAVVVAAPGAARAAVPQYTIAIGYNGLPPAAPEGLAPLRFADDDAASFYEFARGLSRRSQLLAVLDTETQARFPGLAAETRAPTLAEVRRAVAEVAEQLHKDDARGEKSTVLIFYSGHGTRSASGQGSLSLLDGELTRDALYNEILPVLKDHVVHLFIDACHAESIVRPRDAQATVVDASAADVRAYLQDATLARFPEVGAVMASTVGAQSHEWDVYQGGVFTHELLSALRGAADVDGNGRIEYSELAAFLAAANREVSDTRARPHSVVHAPALDPRVAIVTLADLRRSSFIEGRPGFLGSFFIEDARGRRLLDMRAERDFKVQLAVPGGDVLYVRNEHREAAFSPEPGQRVRFEELVMVDASIRVRGSLDAAFRHGLFATRFGPDYYRGFVDQPGGFVPVALPDLDLTAVDPSDRPPQARPGRRTAGIVLGVASAGLVAGAGVFGVLSWKARNDFDATDLERPANDAKERYQRDMAVGVGLLVGAAVAGGISALLLTRE